MIATQRCRNARFSLMLLPPLMGLVVPAQAQLGGLIKKGVAKLAPKSELALLVPDTVTFTNVVLELTPDRIAKIVAAKRAARQFASGPNGPVAIDAKMGPLDARQARLYDKNVAAINAWDQQRRDRQNCIDSAFIAIRDRARQAQAKRAQSDPQFMQKMMELSQAMQAAQQRGDTATLHRLIAETSQARGPTKSDSLEADMGCHALATPPTIQEWLGLKSQLDSLAQQRLKAEVGVTQVEVRESGMTSRQLGISCERIALFVARLKLKSKQKGFTAKELEALQQAIKDLEGLCQ